MGIQTVKMKRSLEFLTETMSAEHAQFAVPSSTKPVPARKVEERYVQCLNSPDSVDMPPAILMQFPWQVNRICTACTLCTAEDKYTVSECKATRLTEDRVCGLCDAAPACPGGQQRLGCGFSAVGHCYNCPPGSYYDSSGKCEGCGIGSQGAGSTSPCIPCRTDEYSAGLYGIPSGRLSAGEVVSTGEHNEIVATVVDASRQYGDYRLRWSKHFSSAQFAMDQRPILTAWESHYAARLCSGDVVTEWTLPESVGVPAGVYVSLQPPQPMPLRAYGFTPSVDIANAPRDWQVLGRIAGTDSWAALDQRWKQLDWSAGSEIRFYPRPQSQFYAEFAFVFTKLVGGLQCGTSRATDITLTLKLSELTLYVDDGCNKCPSNSVHTDSAKASKADCECPEGMFLATLAADSCTACSDSVCVQQYGESYYLSECGKAGSRGECVSCADSDCPDGQYRINCGAFKGAGECASCPNPSPTQYTITQCKEGLDNTRAPVFGECSDLACPAGFYRTGCGHGNKGSCTACSACSAGSYTSVECQQGGDYGQDRQCLPCSSLFCDGNRFRKDCGIDGSVGFCTQCTTCDQYSYYSTVCKAGGTDALADAVCVECAACPANQWMSRCDHATQSPDCQVCRSDPPDSVGSCPSGQSWDASECGGRSPGRCTGCTNCDAGKYIVGCSAESTGTCEPCTAKTYTKAADLYSCDAVRLCSDVPECAEQECYDASEYTLTQAGRPEDSRCVPLSDCNRGEYDQSLAPRAGFHRETPRICTSCREGLGIAPAAKGIHFVSSGAITSASECIFHCIQGYEINVISPGVYPATPCTKCQRGKFKLGINQDTCSSCPTGRYEIPILLNSYWAFRRQ